MKEKLERNDPEYLREQLRNMYYCSLRYLGPCPNTDKKCKGVDSIVGVDIRDNPENILTCENCRHTWPENELRETHPKLTCVLVRSMPGSVDLYWPRMREIPEVRLIVRVLNTAIMERFGLQAEAATEGGFGGKIKGEYVEFVNHNNEIGLWDNIQRQDVLRRNAPQSKKVLAWYYKLLQTVFQEKIKLGGRSARAAVLKIDPKAPDVGIRVLTCLMAALSKIENPRFAEIIRNRVANPGFLEETHLAGLTLEQIKRLYVNPSNPQPASLRKKKGWVQ